MTSARAVEDSAEGNAEPNDTPADNPKVQPSAGTAEEDEEHDRGRSSSSRGEEGELSALSWEEIPSSTYIPPHHYSLSCPRPCTIPSDFTVSFLLSPVDPLPPSIPSDIYSAPTCLYSPHTHADTNPKPRTAFFSVGRRLGVARDPAHPRQRPSPPRPRNAASAPRSPCRHPQQPATSPGMCIVRRQKKIKAFPVARQQVFKPPVRFQHRRQPRRAHPHPDTADSPQPLMPALYPSIHALQLHQCLMEAILNHQNSDHRSSKQDDFLGDESDTVVASAPTATSHERTVAAESPVANAESRSKGDGMSSEMVDPSSPPLVPTTLHVPAEFKTQVLRSPLLVCLPHRSISRAEQCEVAFYRQLHSVPLKIERPV